MRLINDRALARRPARAVAALLLAACGLVAPVPSWAQTTPSPTPATAARLMASESLQALLARTLDNDPQVRTALHLHQASEARRLQARSKLGPSLTLSSTVGRAVEQDFGQTVNRDTQRTEAGMRWNVYNHGQDLAEFRASTREAMAAAEDLRRAREDAAERLATAYAELAHVEQVLPRAGERLDALRRLAQQVQRQVEAGKASPPDEQQARASLLDAEILHEQLLADRDSAYQRLALLAGGPPRTVQPVVLAAPDIAAGPEAHGPPAQVRAAQQRADAARARVPGAVSLATPRVDIEYRHQLSDRTTPQPSTEQQRGWLVSARWDVPVGGELQARRAETRHRADAADAEAERVAQGLQAELAMLGPRAAQAQRAAELLGRQVLQYDQLVRAGELQVEAGRRSLAQLMQLHDSRFNAEQRQAEQAQRALLARLRSLALRGELLAALGINPTR